MAENKNYINGKWTSSSGGTYDQCNPADLTEVTGQPADPAVLLRISYWQVKVRGDGTGPAHAVD